MSKRDVPHLRSTAEELRQLYEQSITVRFIAEPLDCCGLSESASKAYQHMQGKGFDVLGIKDAQDVIIGYVHQEHLSDVETCEQAKQDFAVEEIFASTAPLMKVLKRFQETDKERFFILEDDCITQIVTRADLQKIPVRMLLFGLVTLVEMHSLRLVKVYYGNDEWKKKLSKKRNDKAIELHNERKVRNQDISIVDCLQLSDKFYILRKTEKFKDKTRLSGNEIEDFGKKLEGLRNNLAHGQNLTSKDGWKDILLLANEVESFLIQLEKIGT